MDTRAAARRWVDTWTRNWVARNAEPLVDGDRASVAWWAIATEEGQPITYAGVSLLRFDADGLVIDEWDAWNMLEGEREPPPGWGAAG